jgi:hypothetical protein
MGITTTNSFIEKNMRLPLQSIDSKWSYQPAPKPLSLMCAHLKVRIAECIRLASALKLST